MMETISPAARAGWLRSRPLSQMRIAGLAIGGGMIIIQGGWLPWFSLYAGLQPYRGVDLLNGRLLVSGGLLSILLGVWFVLRGSHRVRWGIGLLGFVLLAFASWSLFQLLAFHRRLSADHPFAVATTGPGLIVVVAGALVVFATLFLSPVSMTDRRE